MKKFKLKSRSKLKARIMLGVGIIAGLLLALNMFPIGGTNARNTWIYKNMDGDISTLTVCDPNDNSKCLTIMDRNLGATKAGTSCNSADTGACGYHFQWGNNHGFEIGCYSDRCSDEVTLSATGTLATWFPDYNHLGYIGYNFIMGTSMNEFDYREDNNPSNHDGLRGGENDDASNNYGLGLNNQTDRKGPCPEGYHIPSEGERGMLIQYWAANYTGQGNNLKLTGRSPLYSFSYNKTGAVQFRYDFKIPLAGSRNCESAQIRDINYQANFRASSSSNPYFFMYDNAMFTNWGTYRTNGYSIRCFKDIPFNYPSKIQVTIRDNSKINQIFNGELFRGDKISESGAIMSILSEYSGPRYGYIFSGWYDQDLNINWDLDRPIITELDLQALYVPMECTVSFDTNGGTEVDSVTGYYDSVINEPRSPIKLGYAFDGWYMDEQLTQNFDFGSTLLQGNLVLYAKWKKCEEGYNLINNRCVSNLAGVYYESGAIKITNGETTIYIKDKNQGAEKTFLDSEAFEALKIIEKIGLAIEELPCQNTYDGCSTGDFLYVINYVTENNFESIEEADLYFQELYDMAYNPEEYKDIYGTFYFWGNNNGAMYDEMQSYSGDADFGLGDSVVVDELLYLRGFDNGKIGNDETGRGVGEDDNPCDSTKGEYLPTISDRENLLKIWGDIYGLEYNYYIGNNNVPDIFLDTLFIPSLYISYQYPTCRCGLSPFCYNRNNGNVNLLTLLFSYPVYAYEDRILYRGNGVHLWASDGTFGGLICGSNELLNDFDSLDDSQISRLNNTAAPVRCFLRSYTINFDTDGGSNIDSIEVVGSQSIQRPNNPEKTNYIFKGWYSDPEFTEEYDFSSEVSGNITLYAKWEKVKTSGGRQLKKDNCPGGDYSNSYYDGDCGSNPKEENKQQHNSSEEVIYDTLVFNPHYNDEQNQAYQYAYHYGITTKAPISNANIDGNLTRIAMAKMLSQYAINVLGMKPDKNRNNQFKDVTDKLDGEYDDGVTLAYQLGIMGINMPNNEFRPNDLVPRAEFVTALSRLLYKTPDGMFEETPRYYIPHMEKLIYEGIISNPDPKMLELRGYVMLMLMRSDK